MEELAVVRWQEEREQEDYGVGVGWAMRTRRNWRLVALIGTEPRVTTVSTPPLVLVTETGLIMVANPKERLPLSCGVKV